MTTRPKRRRGIKLKPTDFTKLDKIRPEDIARTGGGPVDEGE